MRKHNNSVITQQYSTLGNKSLEILTQQKYRKIKQQQNNGYRQQYSEGNNKRQQKQQIEQKSREYDQAYMYSQKIRKQLQKLSYHKVRHIDKQVQKDALYKQITNMINKYDRKQGCDKYGRFSVNNMHVNSNCNNNFIINQQNKDYENNDNIIVIRNNNKNHKLNNTVKTYQQNLQKQKCENNTYNIHNKQNRRDSVNISMMEIAKLKKQRTSSQIKLSQIQQCTKNTQKSTKNKNNKNNKSQYIYNSINNSVMSNLTNLPVIKNNSKHSNNRESIKQKSYEKVQIINDSIDKNMSRNSINQQVSEGKYKNKTTRNSLFKITQARRYNIVVNNAIKENNNMNNDQLASIDQNNKKSQKIRSKKTKIKNKITFNFNTNPNQNPKYFNQSNYSYQFMNRNQQNTINDRQCISSKRFRKNANAQQNNILNNGKVKQNNKTIQKQYNSSNVSMYRNQEDKQMQAQRNKYQTMSKKKQNKYQQFFTPKYYALIQKQITDKIQQKSVQQILKQRKTNIKEAIKTKTARYDRNTQKITINKSLFPSMHIENPIQNIIKNKQNKQSYESKHLITSVSTKHSIYSQPHNKQSVELALRYQRQEQKETKRYMGMNFSRYSIKQLSSIHKAILQYSKGDIKLLKKGLVVALNMFGILIQQDKFKNVNVNFGDNKKMTMTKVGFSKNKLNRDRDRDDDHKIFKNSNGLNKFCSINKKIKQTGFTQKRIQICTSKGLPSTKHLRSHKSIKSSTNINNVGLNINKILQQNLRKITHFDNFLQLYRILQTHYFKQSIIDYLQILLRSCINNKKQQKKRILEQNDDQQEYQQIQSHQIEIGYQDIYQAFLKRNTQQDTIKISNMIQQKVKQNFKAQIKSVYKSNTNIKSKQHQKNNNNSHNNNTNNNNNSHNSHNSNESVNNTKRQTCYIKQRWQITITQLYNLCYYDNELCQLIHEYYMKQVNHDKKQYFYKNQQQHKIKRYNKNSHALDLTKTVLFQIYRQNVSKCYDATKNEDDQQDGGNIYTQESAQKRNQQQVKKINQKIQQLFQI